MAICEGNGMFPKRLQHDAQTVCRTVVSEKLSQKHGEQVQGCIKKFLDWSPGAKTANCTALCH